MTICFIANQRITVFCEQVARQLERDGERVVWASPSARWTAYLVYRGVPREAILDLSLWYEEWAGGRPISPEDFSRLDRIENRGRVTVANIILMDRTLRTRPSAIAYAYLAVVAREIESFLSRNNVDLVLGECTWALETMTAQICENEDRLYLQPATARIPSTRSVFFRGTFQEEVLELKRPEKNDFDLANNIIEKLCGEEIKPHYIARNLQTMGFRRHWWEEARLALLPSQSNRADESVPPFVTRAFHRARKAVRRIAVGLQAPFEPAPNVADGPPFVLVLLHVQPEASIDVLAHRFHNQLENIRSLARLLPCGYELYVKEHSVAMGDRYPGFYREIRSLPSVRLIDPLSNTADLIRRACLTLTPSGTAAFEAGLMGRPAATFSKKYFAPVLVAPALNPYALDERSFRELLEAPSIPAHSDRVAFLAWLLAQSVDARFSDPVSDPTVMQKRNVQNFSAGVKCAAAASRHSR
jgi:hypothetical protein